MKTGVVVVSLVILAVVLAVVLTQGNNGTACSKEAKMCLDGSYVGRTGPHCAFAECPTARTVCTPELRNAQVCPDTYWNLTSDSTLTGGTVCGWFKPTVNCLKYPCAAEYYNGCACSDDMVEYYTSGACPTELNGGHTCTEEAMICPDGSAVGRTGPNCAFAPCPSTQIANPASVNCIDKGGALEIKDGPGGQYGMCTLPNGTQCEEWALFRGECP